jgi:multidrug efflux pump subunit AcrB
MVSDLENNILSGLVLVVFVILFAMGIRNAVLVSLAIPFSMLLSFTVLYALDITLNMVVLFSLTLALGMLVDNAIVIVENIYRYLEQGVPRLEAAQKATSEVAYAVIGSTMTTLAAFFPHELSAPDPHSHPVLQPFCCHGHQSGPGLNFYENQTS